MGAELETIEHIVGGCVEVRGVGPVEAEFGQCTPDDSGYTGVVRGLDRADLNPFH